LARAEKLFHKGNYPLAQGEFEKAQGMLNQGHGAERRKDIAEKIQICKKETERLRADDLVKRAKKHLRKNNPQEALRVVLPEEQPSGGP